MSEQLGVYGSFRNSATIHSYVLTMLTTAELMNDLRKVFLTYPTLTSNEHGQVSRCHLHSNIDGTVQSFGIADDSETKLDVLNICLYHSLNENHDKITNKSAYYKLFGQFYCFLFLRKCLGLTEHPYIGKEIVEQTRNKQCTEVTPHYIPSKNTFEQNKEKHLDQETCHRRKVE